MNIGVLFFALCWLGSSSLVPAAAATAAQQTPPASDVQGAGTLSDKLSNSNGVIHPAETADPGMTKTPPASGGTTMPVIPPPGSPGGDPAVKPK